MRFATVRDFSQKPSKFISSKENIIITRHGKPVRALVPLTEEDIDDFVLQEKLDLETEVQKALSPVRRGNYLTITQLRKRYGST